MQCFFVLIAKKMSKFAQERAKQLKKSDKEKPEPVDSLPPQNIIIGNIVERTESAIQTNIEEHASFDDSKGFPKPQRIDQKVI